MKTQEEAEMPGKWMDHSIQHIMQYRLEVSVELDKMYGEGYSKNNPALVGQLVLACTKEFDSHQNYHLMDKFLETLEGIQQGIYLLSDD